MDPFWGQFGPIFKSYVGFRDGVIMKNTTPLWFLLKPKKCATFQYQQNQPKRRNKKLVGGFNPIETYARQIGSFPQFSG